MSQLKISIIVPFYNTPVSYFQKCIDALQKLEAFEVILIDDCSNDEETIKLAKDSGFKYLKTPYQSGHDGMPLNIGVKEANGDYICRVDSDDILLALPKTMTKDICFGKQTRIKSAINITLEELILGPRALCNALVAKREIFLKHPFAEDSNVFGDILFVLQLLYNNYSFETFPKVNYIYKKRKGSLQASKPYFHHRLRNIQTVARLCQIENISEDESLRLLKLAMENLKSGSKAMKKAGF
ncbi:MAG: glycosyltransferase family 2 protein [Sulfurimonas sp.]|nr:glycosyltransferase family 2 protein [Sulfurimonas sp.]